MVIFCAPYSPLSILHWRYIPTPLNINPTSLFCVPFSAIPALAHSLPPLVGVYLLHSAHQPPWRNNPRLALLPKPRTTRASTRVLPSRQLTLLAQWQFPLGGGRTKASGAHGCHRCCSRACTGGLDPCFLVGFGKIGIGSWVDFGVGFRARVSFWLWSERDILRMCPECVAGEFYGGI